MTAKCRDCGAEGEWRELASGKWLLYSMQPHVKECPKRRKKEAANAQSANGGHLAGSRVVGDDRGLVDRSLGKQAGLGLFGARSEATKAEQEALIEALKRAEGE